MLLLGAVGCEKNEPTPRSTTQELPLGAHATLAGSFVSGDSASLKSLLHPDLLVQPPSPDSALQGTAALSYLLTLSANTRVADSRLYPHGIVPEGPFAFEQGLWEIRVGDRRLRSPYILRWRMTSDGWRVALWRWERFR